MKLITILTISLAVCIGAGVTSCEDMLRVDSKTVMYDYQNTLDDPTDTVYSVLGMNDPFYRHSLGDTDYGLRATENNLEIWSVAGYCGVCDLHERPVVWMDPSKPLKERWSNFFSPLGNNPFEYFHYRRKHYGLVSALSRFASNFIHFLFPRLWTGKCLQ